MALNRSPLLLSLPIRARAYTCVQCRHLHRSTIEARPIPQPTPFVPDVQTFLTLIGRKTSQHAAKIPSWEALFTLSGQSLREAGIEPARDRRYILWWRDRYRNGIRGVGGDLDKVKDGVAELRLAEAPSAKGIHRAATPTKSAGMMKVIVNTEPSVALPTDAAAAETTDGAKESTDPEMTPRIIVQPEKVKQFEGLRVSHAEDITGSGVEAVKGHPGVARLRVREGLWEVSRGHKIDGGERRKAEVRYKRRVAEKKKSR